MILQTISYLLFSLGFLVIAGRAVDFNIWYMIPLAAVILGFGIHVFSTV